MTKLETASAQRKTDKAVRWQYLCGRLDFQSLADIGDDTYICSLHFVGARGPTFADDEPILCEPMVVRVPKRKYKAREERDLPANPGKKRCLKTKRDEELLAKRRLQYMISGKINGIEDLQELHIQLLTAFTEMQAEADRLRADNEKLQHALQSDFSKLSYRILRCDTDQVIFLTGLHPLVFDWLLPKVERTIFRVHPEVTQQDHLLIVLMKLKLGLSDNDLGYRFGLDGDIIAPIIQTWIPAVAAVLSPLIEWPSDDAIAKTKPSCFNEECSECRCILDTLDVTIAMPDATTKVVSYVICATPAGTISFLSQGFSCGKRQLIKGSGFMDHLKPKDLLLSNKALPIPKELSAVGVTLLTPVKAVSKKPAASNKLDISVDVWRQVDKVLDWWKDFSVFQLPIPEAYEEMLDDLVVICAALTNVKISLQ